ncbi:MAG: major capsid protein [Bacteroidales bacterium]|nr:major capsid protein [Candidatus Scybalousia scybalohippi]
MPFNVLEAIDAKERLSFSQNFSVVRPSVLDRLFPDVKTEYIEAEYLRLMQGQNLPTTALVHALDTEANIGQRPSFEKVLQEKLFIKEKINQSEKLQMLINKGVPDDENLINWVFDDMSRLSESVVTRTLVAKGQVMSAGKMSIHENNVTLDIDFGVPTDQKIAFGDWSNVDYDIFGDIQGAMQLLADQGITANRALTSSKQISQMRKNKSMQVAVLGGANARLLTKAELANLLMEEFGLVIDVCDDKFAFIKADGSRGNARYFKEDVFTIYTADAAGRLGTGLWGPTPEELEYRQFIENENRSFVTVTMWATQDPVAKWTKASGMFIPVLPNPYGIVIGEVGKK